MKMGFFMAKSIVLSDEISRSSKFCSLLHLFIYNFSKTNIMKVSVNEMNLALEIVREYERPSLNHVLEMVLRYNSSEGQMTRIDFMKIDRIVTQIKHVFSPAAVIPFNNRKKIMAETEILLAVA